MFFFLTSHVFQTFRNSQTSVQAIKQKDFEISGQCYKDSTFINYDYRVVVTRKLLILRNGTRKLFYKI